MDSDDELFFNFTCGFVSNFNNDVLICMTGFPIGDYDVFSKSTVVNFFMVFVMKNAFSCVFDVADIRIWKLGNF